jgi:2-polyprenyl-3-methyl-5-hydroxy-6-metoxy-1,4-benzoquinol methylase
VVSLPLDLDRFEVKDDDKDFYGKQYYQLYATDKLGYPGLADRARLDLPERCLHWLRALLKYKLPPGRILELGSAHGAFVALLGWTGFEASGLELSPWLVRFAKATFGITMLTGKIEEQEIEAGSLDAIVLMDVLEHLRDPVGTMKRCLTLLKLDGILLVQTPRYPEGTSFAEMRDKDDSFLLQLKPEEHIYLFSKSSATQLFTQCGARYVVFEQAIFSHYDMFFIVGREPLVVNAKNEIERALLRAPVSRLVLALLDLQMRGE